MRRLLPQVVNAYAQYDRTERYRYLLGRDFALDPKHPCLWIMLNPSTATSTVDDPTVRKCQQFSLQWGHDACRVVNIFALRSTDPRALRAVDDPVGPGNDDWIDDECARAARIVCAWGNHGTLHGRGQVVWDRLKATYALHFFAMTQQDQPIHPLYLSMQSELLTHIA